MVGRPFRRRWVRIAGAVALLPLVILLIGIPLAMSSALPERGFEFTLANEAVAGELFVAVSGYLGTIAVALVVGSAILIQLREGGKADSVKWALALAGALAAMLSIFLGFRFQTDVATQLSVHHLNVPAIISGFRFQAIFLMVSAAFLTGLAVDRLAPGAGAGARRGRKEERDD